MSAQQTENLAVTVSRLRKDYGRVTALQDVDISIDSGEFISLLGPSGCGKTTLLRCIAGLIHPTSGRICVSGRSVTELPVHKRNFGMVFQSYALFPHMSVAKNVAFGLEMARVGKVETEARVLEALQMVAMEKYISRYPNQLSGGQQQRVALARAIVTRPSVLLLDEPFGALDAKLRSSLQTDVRALQKKLHVTTIFVTHDQQEAMLMSDRIAVMNNGQIHQFASPETVYNLPATGFVASFVGQVNEITQAGCPVPHGGRAILRPERVRIGGAGAPEGASCISGEVSEIVFSGDTILTTVMTSAGPIISSRKNIGESSSFAIGSKVGIWFLPDDVLTFDANGMAIAKLPTH